MSTSVYNGELYEGFTRESVAQALDAAEARLLLATPETTEFVIEIGGIEVWIDFAEMELTVIA